MIVDLYKQYTAENRHYHTLDHIFGMFKTAQLHDIEVSDALILAIWFHDALYDPEKIDGENETASADAARAYCQVTPGLKQYDETVYQAIMDTHCHCPTRGNPISPILIDLDLWMLSNISDYIVWRDRVRKEYSHLSEKEWVKGRMQWIGSMLARDSIYVSEYATKLMERNARLNLMDEMTALRVKVQKWKVSE